MGDTINQSFCFPITHSKDHHPMGRTPECRFMSCTSSSLNTDLAAPNPLSLTEIALTDCVWANKDTKRIQLCDLVHYPRPTYSLFPGTHLQGTTIGEGTKHSSGVEDGRLSGWWLGSADDVPRSDFFMAIMYYIRISSRARISESGFFHFHLARSFANHSGESKMENIYTACFF